MVGNSEKNRESFVKNKAKESTKDRDGHRKSERKNEQGKKKEWRAGKENGKGLCCEE